MKRLLVCGGRDYHDRDRVYQELDREKPDVIITGGAQGADALAGKYAGEKGVPLIIMPAPWAIGSSAGPIRNGWMIRFANPTEVLAFPGGKGTANMVDNARRAGLPVREVAG